MKRHKLALGLGLLTLVILPASAQDQSYRTQVPFADVLRWPLSGIHEEVFLVLENATEWCQLWETVFPGRDCDMSVIDFSSQAMLAANLGDRPDLCFEVSITGVERRGGSGHVMVDVVETQHTTGCVCPLAIGQPLHVVAIDKPVKKPVFNKEFVALTCDP